MNKIQFYSVREQTKFRCLLRIVQTRALAHVVDIVRVEAAVSTRIVLTIRNVHIY